MHQLPTLSRMLKQARLQASMTREELARAAKVEPMVIYNRMEDATMMPSLSTLRRLCAVLQLDFDTVVNSLRDEDEVHDDEAQSQ
jgi:transcriptional regulator with XRE-family HTH domain